MQQSLHPVMKKNRKIFILQAGKRNLEKRLKAEKNAKKLDEVMNIDLPDNYEEEFWS
ncbi:hypothetical protein [Methanosarcina horonobensis]|uniref:hypothetical protein n=1 Tax=Methanosarcina horonobensis TaxID=418008 RepID=UPI0022B87651|nr:hypothetical protein [Methanosarcina horonobensis]